MTPDDWPNRAHSRFVDTPRIRWHVQVMGEGPVLLLLHGTGAATHSWRAVAPLLAAHFTVVAPDLPGHGFTIGRPVGGLSMPTVARAVADLTRTLNADPAVDVGHSAGAAIATRLAIDGLVKPRAIVGLSAALMPFPGLAAKIFPALARALFVNPFAPHVFAAMMRAPGETARFLARSTASRVDAEGIACYARLFASPAHCAGALAMMTDWDLATLRRDLPRLATPLLLLHGDRDPAIPPQSARDAAALVATARFEPLVGLGHLAHEEAPGDVAARITAFAREYA